MNTELIQETTKLDRDYTRLREIVTEKFGFIMPPPDDRRAFPVMKFLSDYGDDYFNTGKVSGSGEPPSKEEILRRSASHPSNKLFKDALNRIARGISNKSVHQLANELDELNKIVNG